VPRRPGRREQAPPPTRPGRPASNASVGSSSELEATRQQLQEALERHTAIAEVLRAIAGSPTDLQPVLDAIAASTAKFCVAEDAAIVLLRAEPSIEWSARSTYVAAHDGAIPPTTADLPHDRRVVTGRSILERQTIHVEDILAGPDEYPVSREHSRRLGVRTVLATPLLRDGPPIGAVLLRRIEVRPFTERQIDLLRTFADQAVIAIENVRLFTETKEALERQTAIGEILRAIAGSPTDVHPVLEAITASAIRFCAAEDALVMLPEGQELRLAAHTGPVPIADSLSYPLDGSSMSATAFAEARVLHTDDLQAEASSFPAGAASARASGYHSVLVAPLLREGTAIGTIGLRRSDARPFTDRHIDLLRTFADQAVIAIENVRLFNETKEALEHQTATSSLLEVISRSTTEIAPVFETILEDAIRLCAADAGLIFQRDGDGYRLVASRGATAAGLGPVASGLRPDRTSVGGRVLLEGRTIHIRDATLDPELDPSLMHRATYHSRLGVPLLKDGSVIGILGIWRTAAGGFPETQVRLVETFARQAVIAIENVRLFNETIEKSAQLEAANQELAASSRHKSEFLANMSHELRTPLNAIIGFSDVLEQRMFGELNERQADYTHDILTSGRHLLDLVNEILDLSKVEAGRMELEPSEFALDETIRGALAFVRERAVRHGIALGADVPTDLGTIVGDERKVRQVLLNLLSNAVKFTPDGGTISVQVRRGDGEVQVSVRDTGIGIASEDQAKVFDEFQQVGKASDRSREGTGLGLTLAKRFVELHGGRIWIESEVAKGTTFIFAIPVKRAAAALS